MATRALTDIVTSARQRADMENDDTFLASSEATQMATESLRALYDLIIEAGDEELLPLNAQTLTLVAGTASYSLTNDPYMIKGVDVTLGGETYSAKPYMFHDRNAWSEPQGLGNKLYYRMAGPATITFKPTPTQAGTAVVYSHVTISASGSIEFYANWEEWLILDLAIKFMLKEDRDVSVMMLRQQQAEQRIRSMASRRSPLPQSVVETEA